MRAALLKNWEQLELTDLPKPVAGEGEALIKVIYGGVCGSDISVYQGHHLTAKAPVVLCHEILGTIETLPEGYNGPFSVGQRVVMNPVISCGHCAACRSGYANACSNLELLGIHVNGGFEEYTKVAADKLVAVNDELPDMVATLSEPFAVGYHVNTRAGTKPGMKVLVVGSGTIGLVLAHTAREFGAEVHVSEMNADRLAIAERFDFHTVNVRDKDIMEYMNEVTDGAGFDAIFDTSGAKVTALQMPDLCRVGGVLISMGLSGKVYEFVIGKVSFKEQKLIGSRLYSQEDFENGVGVLNSLAKKYDMTQMISDFMPLSEIQPAIDKMMKQENLGKILIDCSK